MSNNICLFLISSNFQCSAPGKSQRDRRGGGFAPPLAANQGARSCRPAAAAAAAAAAAWAAWPRQTSEARGPPAGGSRGIQDPAGGGGQRRRRPRRLAVGVVLDRRTTGGARVRRRPGARPRAQPAGVRPPSHLRTSLSGRQAARRAARLG